MKTTYSMADGIGRIVLSNPPYNRLTSPLFADPEELGSFLADTRVKAVILSGAGRHFSAGADLGRVRGQIRDPADLAAKFEGGTKLLEMIAFAPVPVLALIRGSCLGAGLEVALSCHFRFASESAMLGFPEAEHGLMPGFGGTAFTGGLDRGRVVELILSGRMVGAGEALSLGLVYRILPGRELEAGAAAFLHSLTARRSPLLIRSVMEAVHAGRRLPLEEALERETDLFLRLARKNE